MPKESPRMVRMGSKALRTGKATKKQTQSEGAEIMRMAPRKTAPKRKK